MTKELQNLIDKIENAKNCVLDVFIDENKDGNKFDSIEVLKLIDSLVEAAEQIITTSKSGAVKQQLVIDAFAHFDRKYKLVDKIDDAIDLPFWVEPFDGKFIRKGLHFLISQSVVTMNRMKTKKSSRKKKDVQSEK